MGNISADKALAVSGDLPKKVIAVCKSLWDTRTAALHRAGPSGPDRLRWRPVFATSHIIDSGEARERAR